MVMVTVTVEAVALMLTQGQAPDAGGDPCGAPRAAAQRKRSVKPSKVVIVVVGVGWCRKLLGGLSLIAHPARS